MTKFLGICIVISSAIASVAIIGTEIIEQESNRFIVIPEGAFVYRVDKRTGSVEVSRAYTYSTENQFQFPPFRKIE